MSARNFLVCGISAMLATTPCDAGIFQRTSDGKTLVWNNAPQKTDVATWSGERDSDDQATGPGTLTWYREELTIVTGSNLPRSRKVLVGRYSGKMARGKFEGAVVNVDANGKTFHGTFVRGKRVRGWTPGPLPPEPDRDHAPVETADIPAAGPRPTPELPPAAAAITLASLTPPPTLGSPGMETMDPPEKDRIISDFKEQTLSVLSRVNETTGSFRVIDRIDALPKLPPPAAGSITSLIDRARDVRSKLGHETVVKECPAETQTVDALSVYSDVTRDVANNNAAEAGSRLRDFLKASPSPVDESQKDLWNYLTSLELLFNRSEQEAKAHSGQAEQLDTAGRTSEAIREYQTAYKIFPNPGTAEKIRQLKESSLGL